MAHEQARKRNSRDRGQRASAKSAGGWISDRCVRGAEPPHTDGSRFPRRDGTADFKRRAGREVEQSPPAPPAVGDGGKRLGHGGSFRWLFIGHYPPAEFPPSSGVKIRAPRW